MLSRIFRKNVVGGPSGCEGGEGVAGDGEGIAAAERLSAPLRPPARLEEEVLAADKGCAAIIRFPAEDLPIANAYR